MHSRRSFETPWGAENIPIALFEPPTALPIEATKAALYLAIDTP